MTQNAKLLTPQITKIERNENLHLWKAYWHGKRELVDRHYAYNIRVRPTPAKLPDFDKDGLVDPNLNEMFLFHGTSHEMLGVIADHGFDERVSALNGGYGAGIYLTDDFCKASEYASADSATGDKVLFINRVVLGDPIFMKSALRNARRPPERGGDFSPGTTFDSVIATTVSTKFSPGPIGSGGEVRGEEHREIVVYDHHQVYPEYIVHFKLV